MVAQTRLRQEDHKLKASLQDPLPKGKKAGETGDVVQW
jgi:hypothetical protein